MASVGIWTLGIRTETHHSNCYANKLYSLIKIYGFQIRQNRDFLNF